jgi:hypothetical protein
MDSFRPNWCLHTVCLKIRLSSLVYGIVSVRKRVTYITNQVLTSKHECVLDLFGCDLHLPKRLAKCKLYTQYCSANPQSEVFVPETLFCSKKSHRMPGEPQCHCKLSLKEGPGSLKSLCVNQLSKFTDCPLKTRKRTNRKCKNRLRFSKYEVRNVKSVQAVCYCTTKITCKNATQLQVRPAI